MDRVLKKLMPVLGVFLFVLAVLVLRHELKEYNYAGIISYIKGIPPQKILLSGAFTILSYFVLTLYDTLALKHLARPLGYGRVAMTSFVSYTFSHNTGAVLSGAAVRYRVYASLGLSSMEITGLIAFTVLSGALGILTVGGVSLLVWPFKVPESLHLPLNSPRPLGAVFLLLVAGYLYRTIIIKKALKIMGWDIPMPRKGVVLGQMTIALMDWLLASAVFYALLQGKPGYPEFVGIFILAQLAGMASFIPGGLGVFDAAIVVLLSPYIPAPQALGTVIVYRVVYYMVPFVLGLATLGAYEAYIGQKTLSKANRLVGKFASWLAPYALSVIVFIGGSILLFSGVIPAKEGRLFWLHSLVPLPVIEVSHFLGSIIGAILLIVARGLSRRIDFSYHLTIMLLGAGMVFSLLKGFDYEEAIALAMALALLVPARKVFYRKSSFIVARLTTRWLVSVALVLAASLFLLEFSYRDEVYSHELWWRFAFEEHASRSLRALVGAVSVLLIYSIYRLLGPGAPRKVLPDEDTLMRVENIVRSSETTDGNLALLGDKSILLSESGNSFIMYAVSGRTWAAMRDPAGKPSEYHDLVWKFLEICDVYDGKAVFYEVCEKNMALYLEAGLSFLKIGEYGRVPLESFTLEGGSRKEFRHTLSRLEREGCSFDIIPAGEVGSIMKDLRDVSDSWLASRNIREKGFSTGFFKEDYLVRYPAAVARKDGVIMAFANVWQGGGKEELSVDLMRYRQDSPHGLMDYLFLNLMLWGKKEGYRWFSFGMAPLSGLEDRALAPLWNRFGSFLFRHGEHFYNFQGLRSYKEKFDPVWEPRYMAYPGGIRLALILVDIAALISRGKRGKQEVR